jgi:hypothetical protein
MPFISNAVIDSPVTGKKMIIGIIGASISVREEVSCGPLLLE